MKFWGNLFRFVAFQFDPGWNYEFIEYSNLIPWKLHLNWIPQVVNPLDATSTPCSFVAQRKSNTLCWALWSENPLVLSFSLSLSHCHSVTRARCIPPPPLPQSLHCCVRGIGLAVCLCVWWYFWFDVGASSLPIERLWAPAWKKEGIIYIISGSWYLSGRKVYLMIITVHRVGHL